MIAVFSDLHDNLTNLRTWADWCRSQGIEKAIFCGDLTDRETFQELASLWPGELYFIQGNADNYTPADVPSRPGFHNLGRYGRIKLENRTIGLCHEPEYQAAVLKSGVVDVLFYGHTHKPWQEQRDGTWLVNPGNLSGFGYPPSFALYDPVNNSWELKILQQLTA